MNNNVNKISLCEVCGNTDIEFVLNLGLHPMCDDLVAVGDARVCIEYPIEILFCKKCGTAHQRFQVPKEDLFPSSYHYRSRFTADVLNGMEGLVNSCVSRFGDLAGKTVLDIGCNDGSLLDFFRAKGAVTIGLEPTAACMDAKQKGHITYNEFLSPAAADIIVRDNGKPDFITFTNVFAHIENLGGVLESLRRLMAPHTTIVIENHYLGSVLDGNQFDTFYHEHPRTYSFNSFVHMARSLGRDLLGVEFPSRYGGNIRIFIGDGSGSAQPGDVAALLSREEGYFDKFLAMQQNIEKWKRTKRDFLLAQFKQHGKLRAKAFPGRAAILVKLLDLNEDLISAVYEKPGSLKIGNYLPGTRIPILSDDDLFALPDQGAPLLNLAWHIPTEIRSYLAGHGYKGTITDILGADDFLADKTSQ
jgi:hypothetical protein